MLHPQARALLDAFIERGVPPVHTLEPAVAREGYRQRCALSRPPAPALQSVEDRCVDPGHGHRLNLRLYRPLGVEPGARPPVLVFFHGGGWTVGDLDTHDTLCRELSAQATCVTVSVDYRLGPEHPYPAAVDDCVAATRWVQAHAAELGVDGQRMAVGGDSAGGNLAAVVALQARDDALAGDDRWAQALRFQLLIYPAVDMRRQAPSHHRNGSGYLLTSQALDWYHRHYMGSAERDGEWRASPLLHERHDGVAPALVLTAGFDPLRDEGLAYADALSRAGVPTHHVCFERQIHGFILMGGVLDEAHSAVALCAAALRRGLTAARA